MSQNESRSERPAEERPVGSDRRLIALSALIGAGLVYAGISNTCGMGKVLVRMPSNPRVAGPVCGCGVEPGGRAS